MHIKNLSFSFTTKGPLLLHNLSLACAPGSITIIQGKNGTGKSTLFSILQGKERHQHYLAGSITLGGTNYEPKENGTFPTTFTDHVALVDQDCQRMLADKFTAYENIQMAVMPRYPSLRLLPASAPKNALPFDGNRLVSYLSGGQQQILAIAMVMMMSPRVLLLDEPTAALDSRNACSVMDFVVQQTVEQSLVTLIITHDPLIKRRYGTNQIITMPE